MLIDTYSMLVHAQAETVWKLLLDRVDNPQNYLHGVNGVRIIERSPVGVIREMDWEGKMIREKILPDQDNYRITTHLMEHPALYRRHRKPHHSVSGAEPRGAGLRGNRCETGTKVLPPGRIRPH